MGLGFQKKKGKEKTPPSHSYTITTGAASTTDNGSDLDAVRPVVSASHTTSTSCDVSDDSLDDKKSKLRWPPLRKKYIGKKKRQTPLKVVSPFVAPAKTDDNNKQQPPVLSILGSLNVAVVTDECVEIITKESQRALIEKREAIRRKLCQEDKLSDLVDDKDDGLKEEEIQDDPFYRVSTQRASNCRKLDKVRSTLQYPTEISMPIKHVVLSSSWDSGSLTMISEQPVSHERCSKGSAAISVDVSCTESE